MDIDLQRRIDRTAGTVLCGILSLFPRKDRGRGLKSDPKRILVILLSEMGSLVLARPMFTFLREKYQEAPIYAMVFKRNAECLEVLDLIPPENIFTVDGDSFSGLIRDSIRALRGIRIKEIDTVIDCELFSRISSIYSFLSGAEIRVGFHPHTQEGLYRGHFINRPVLYNPYHHISRQYLNLAKAIELDHMPLVKRKMDDHIPPPPALDRGSVEEMEKRLMGDFPQLEGKKLVLIYPGGGLLPIRAWPLGHFCAVAQDLIEKGYAAGIIGMKQDAGLAEAILAACRSELAIDLTGYTRKLHELITLFHLAALLITNDGGPGHFASLTPIPAIVLFGPETPALYGPLDDKSVALHHPLSCSPCLTAYNHRNSPCDGNNLCLKSLSVEKVLDRAYALLKGGPVPGDEHGQPAGKI
ncbi:MAG: glycosyltransferase family 9 protein [Deltaproteobacteria bacterium]|nr:glycosyltransferase family 9 protein [Deltaproteobacteria bacterium]